MEPSSSFKTMNLLFHENNEYHHMQCIKVPFRTSLECVRGMKHEEHGTILDERP
jgi:hypothetical protein